LLDTASQPLYILDEDRRIVFYNAAFRRWLGAVADELLGRRCAYHSAPEAAGSDALIAGLCPPPAVFSGKRCTGLVVRDDEQGQLCRRRAVFLPLGDLSELIAVVAVVDELDLPDNFVEEAAQDDSPVSESQTLHEALRQIHREQSAEYLPDRLVGTGPAIRRARSQAVLAAETRSTVAITGPKGSGKDRLARTVHFGAGSHQAGMIVPLDCSVLGGDLVRSTAIALAAQDSDSDRPGCNTLLLNGAETISLDAQPELARILLERPFPLRIIATSTCRLIELAKRGEYDSRLALGLSTLEIELPPLVERIEDLPLLVQTFIEQVNTEGGKQVGGATSETLDLLSVYSWPGDVDELAAAVAEAHERAESSEIRPADIPEEIRLALDAAARPRRKETTIQIDEYLAEIERELIERAMTQAKGNKTKAASLLGLNRPRLYRRLVQLGLIEEDSDGLDAE
jgi:DNA-binding NtrC family response regulator